MPGRLGEEDGGKLASFGAKSFMRRGIGKVGGATSGFGAPKPMAGGAFKAGMAAKLKKGLAGKGGGY